MGGWMWSGFLGVTGCGSSDDPVREGGKSGARLLWKTVGRLARPRFSDAYCARRVSLDAAPMRDPPAVSLSPVAACSRYIAGLGLWLKHGVMAGRQWVYGLWRA